MNEILKKYKIQLIAILIVFLLSLILTLIQFFSSKASKKQKPFIEMIPEGFVLLPVEISNGADLISLIGSHGVVDLYSHPQEEKQPKEQVAKALKIITSFSENSRFMAIVPEKQVPYFFEHEGPFYAVLKNPHRQGSQIHKKKVKTSLRILSGEWIEGE